MHCGMWNYLLIPFTMSSCYCCSSGLIWLLLQLYLIKSILLKHPCRLSCPLPVVCGHHEVEQQPDGLLHIDLVGGGQPLVQLVVDGRQDRLQPWHIDFSIVVQCVEAVVTESFDHVPDVHQMNCQWRTQTSSDQRWLSLATESHNRPDGLTKEREKRLLRLHLFCTNRSLQAVL